MTDPGVPRAKNRLADETSVYLRQHMYNPVDWYAWGPEALERAEAEDKPLLVSLGYSACHWCHVMEHESFEDPATAALMNEFFVCIKVDREERPDIDQLYMDAVTRLVGHGGWPLTVFCKPGGERFYGGTYFPPVPRQAMPAFRDLLRNVAEASGEAVQAYLHRGRAGVGLRAGARAFPEAPAAQRQRKAEHGHTHSC